MKNERSCSFARFTAALVLSGLLSACGGSGDSSKPQADAAGDAGASMLKAAQTERAAAVVRAAAAATWVKVANEWTSFSVSTTQLVRYGSGTQWIEKTVSGTVPCTNAFFGRDPLVGVTKQCEVQTAAAPATQVVLNWAEPVSMQTVSNTLTVRLAGQAFRNVEIFHSGRMVARAAVSVDMTTATASIDTRQFPDGALALTAHAWNSLPGAAFTSDADAGTLNLVVANTAPAPAPSGLWNSGIDGLSRDHHNAFGAWRGRPSTSTWINLLWLPWDWLTAPGLSSTSNGQSANVRVWDLYRDFPGVVVLSMSMAGSGNVDRAVYENNMRDCANGAYNSHWATFGTHATAAGRNGNNTVVSLAQEFNGTWFKWHPKNVGLDVWKRCWRNVYNSIKSTSTVKVAWVFSATTVTSNAGADWAVNSVWDAWPADGTGRDYVDVIGVNRYDHPMHGYLVADWRARCANRQDICFAASEARRLGKPLGINEWGPDRDVGNPDNAEFITMMYNFFKDNRDVLMYETHFATILGTDLPGDWHLFPQSSINTKASTRYRQLWSTLP